MNSGALCHFSFSLGLSSAGVAPMPPCFHKLLDETVKTFAVFPSWMYLLDGEDNCLLSVPFSTCDLHVSCWQSGENCQAVAAGASMLLGYALWFSSKRGPPYFSVLLSCPRVVCSMFPSFRLDTAYREAGICAGSRAWSSFFLVWFCTCWLCPVVSSSQREMSLQVMLNLESFLIT